MPSRWAAAILVCGKCEKKLGGGFGKDGRQRLSKLLLKRARGGKGRKAELGVIQSKCLKLCPKRAVTVVNGARPEEWLVVEEGAAIEDVEVRLGLAGVVPGAGLGPLP